jgi:predicted XRE-type DNA-binding protein
MSASSSATSSALMVSGKLHLVRKGHAKRFVGTPPVAPEPARRPARLAVMLALAHKIQQAIDRGAVRDRAEVARRLGLTRARVTQLMDLMLLAPDIQELILFAESVDGVEPMIERTVRAVVCSMSWGEQRPSQRYCGRSLSARSPRESAVGGRDRKTA